MVSTFRCACGVAKYAEELAVPLSRICDLKIFAEVIHQQEKENDPISGSEGLKVIRCWKRGQKYDTLVKELKEFDPDSILIQFQNSMYEEDLMNDSSSFISMVKDFINGGVPVYITLHDVLSFSTNYKLKWYSSLDKVKFICTNKAEQEELRKWAPRCSSAIIPLGATIYEPKDKLESQKKLGIIGNPCIIQPGFLGADKGILELIQEMKKVNREFNEAKIYFAGSLHPLSPLAHKDYVKKCLKASMELLSLDVKIGFIPKFFTDEELITVFSAADILILNHNQTLYIGSSASAKRILYSGKPLIFSDIDPRLSEYEDGVHCLKIGKTRSLLDALKMLENSELREKLIKGSREYSIQNSFEEIAERHLEAFV